jgi:hypothetical protein
MQKSCFFIYVNFFSSGTGVWTQNLIFARQACNHLGQSTCPSPAFLIGSNSISKISLSVCFIMMFTFTTRLVFKWILIVTKNQNSILDVKLCDIWENVRNNLLREKLGLLGKWVSWHLQAGSKWSVDHYPLADHKNRATVTAHTCSLLLGSSYKCVSQRIVVSHREWM